MRKSDKKKDEETRLIAVNIGYMQMVRHTTDERCALACGFSEQTFRRRMKHPEDFTWGEIQSLACLFNCTTQRILYGSLEGGVA